VNLYIDRQESPSGLSIRFRAAFRELHYDLSIIRLTTDEANKPDSGRAVGVAKEKYDVSMAYGERVLPLEVQEAASNRRRADHRRRLHDRTEIAAPGPSTPHGTGTIRMNIEARINSAQEARSKDKPGLCPTCRSRPEAGTTPLRSGPTTCIGAPLRPSSRRAA
jgi:hypothetical protein